MHAISTIPADAYTPTRKTQLDRQPWQARIYPRDLSKQNPNSWRVVMSDQVLTFARTSTRLMSKCVPLAGLFFAFAQLLAVSQQPQISKLKDSPIAHSSTPHEVIDRKSTRLNSSHLGI